MVLTQLDISHFISKDMDCPAKTHWEGGWKWILRYLKGTTDVGLMYGKSLTTRNGGVGFEQEIF